MTNKKIRVRAHLKRVQGKVVGVRSYFRRNKAKKTVKARYCDKCGKLFRVVVKGETTCTSCRLVKNKEMSKSAYKARNEYLIKAEKLTFYELGENKDATPESIYNENKSNFNSIEDVKNAIFSLRKQGYVRKKGGKYEMTQEGIMCIPSSNYISNLKKGA